MSIIVKKALRLATILCSLYISTYVALSANGEYRELWDAHARAWASWYPAGCSIEGSWRGLTRYYLSNTGYLFFPCIYLDRKLIHKGALTVSAQGDGFRIARISENGKRIEPVASPVSPDESISGRTSR